MKNKKYFFIIIIAAVLLCVGIITTVSFISDNSSADDNLDAYQTISSDDEHITSNSYADEEEARIIEEIEKTGEIVYENSQVFEDDDIPGNGNTVYFND